MLRRAAHQKTQYSEKLAEQQDWIETRLAREIERTDLMQARSSLSVASGFCVAPLIEAIATG